MEIPDTRPSPQDNQDILPVIRSTIARYRMIEPGDHVVVAVSGGAGNKDRESFIFRAQGEGAGGVQFHQLHDLHTRA